MTEIKDRQLYDFWMNYAFKPYEYINGEIVPLKKLKFQHSIIALRVTTLLEEFVDQHDLGEVVGANSGFALGDDLLRSPRAAFIGTEKWDSIQYPYSYYDFAPDVSVEIVDVEDDDSVVLRTVSQYILAGTQQVWCIYPDRKSVTVYKNNHKYRRLNSHDTLEGEDVLPGLALPVVELFPGRNRK